jgi:hypothetical protein
MKTPKNREREGGKRVTKRWIRPLEGRRKKVDQKGGRFYIALFLLITLFLLYD